jgi:hypothetical protein
LFEIRREHKISGRNDGVDVLAHATIGTVAVPGDPNLIGIFALPYAPETSTVTANRELFDARFVFG